MATCMTNGDLADFTVLYVMGLWRSGSTILDMIVGSHEDVESVGELRTMPVAWRDGGTCACGEPITECAYWSAVHQRWLERVGADPVPRLIELQERYERVRSLPRVFTEGVLTRTKSFDEYARLLGALFSAIAEVGGKRVIVDSTKYPARALALSRVLGVRLRLVHLVRDGRGVIWSWHRKANVDLDGNVLEVAPEDVVREMTRKWLAINLLSSLVGRSVHERSIRVRYEDLVSDPDAELERIGRVLGIDFARVARGLVEGEPIAVGHTVAGNRVRMEGAIRLRPDLEWQEKLSVGDKRSFWRRAGWLARRYGYAE